MFRVTSLPSANATIVAMHDSSPVSPEAQTIVIIVLVAALLLCLICAVAALLLLRQRNKVRRAKDIKEAV